MDENMLQYVIKNVLKKFLSIKCLENLCNGCRWQYKNLKNL